MTNETLAHAPEPPETESPLPATTALSPETLALAQAIGLSIAAALKDSGKQTLSVQEQADIYANSMRVAMRPENTVDILTTPYNPTGEPMPPLKCPISFMDGDPDAGLLTREEVELYNLLEPGEYEVTKSDGSFAKFRVVPTPDSTGRGYIALNIKPEATDDETKVNWLPLTTVLRQIIGPAADAVKPMPVTPRRAAVPFASPERGTGFQTVNGPKDAALRPHEQEALAAMYARETDPMHL